MRSGSHYNIPIAPLGLFCILNSYFNTPVAALGNFWCESNGESRNGIGVNCSYRLLKFNRQFTQKLFSLIPGSEDFVEIS